MGSSETIVDIIKPIALQALEVAAEALVAGAVYQDIKLKGKKVKVLTAGDDDPVAVIETDTFQYCETNFASTYGYYYEGLRSQPVTGDLPVAGNEDIIVWDKDNGLSDIQKYLQNEFKDSISPGDSIEVANNLAALFLERFQEESLEWTPFVKRFNMSDGLIIDCYVVTSSAENAQGDLSGLVSYCWVAYNHNKS